MITLRDSLQTPHLALLRQRYDEIRQLPPSQELVLRQIANLEYVAGYTDTLTNYGITAFHFEQLENNQRNASLLLASLKEHEAEQSLPLQWNKILVDAKTLLEGVTA